MSKRAQSIAGILMVLMGAVWTGQGLGYIQGSFMTGSATWAIIGPIVAGFGAVLTFNARRQR
jgi:F0F1-type ATP synthase assembly protein I